VACAVMPAAKGNVEPLLGQSFHRHFTYKMTPGSGHLIMSQVETLEQPQTRTVGRLPKNSAKRKRTTRSRSATGKAKAHDGPRGVGGGPGRCLAAFLTVLGREGRWECREGHEEWASGGVGWPGGQADREPRAAAELRLDLDGAAVRRDHPVADRQAQPGPLAD